MPFLAPFFVALGSYIAASKVAIIVSIAISAGTALVTRLLRPQRRIEALDGAKNTIRSEVVPARWVLGEGVRTPGALAYYGSAGREARMALVIGEGANERIADHVWIDGQAVPLVRTVSTDGDLLKPAAGSKFADKIEFREYFAADGTQGLHMRTAVPPAQDNEYDQGLDSGGDYIYGDDPTWETEFSRPRGQAAEPYVTPYPTWDATHKLNGVSWVYVRLTQPAYGHDLDKRFWTRVPNLEFLIDGLKITWPSQAVPTLTSNAAAVRYWWETERRGRLASAIDTASVAAAYALSDEDVDVTNGGVDPLPSGYSAWPSTSKRYSIRGVFASGDDIGGVEDRLDAAWAGEVVESAGKLYFRPGVDRAALLSIGDAQIIEPPVARPWPALQERVNALTGEIPQSAQHDWSTLSLPQVPETVAPAALERAGGKRSGHVRLAFITDPLAAGRLLAVNLRRGQESLRVQLVVMPGNTFEHTGLIPTDRVLLTNAEYGFVQSRFEVERVLIRQDGAVALTLREDLAGTYDDTLVLPPLEPRVIRLPDDREVPDVAGLTSDEIAETGSDGVTAIHLLITWDAADARETEINIRTNLPGAVWESIISVGSNLRVPGVVAGEGYQIRARHWNRRGVAGSWSVVHANTIDGDLTPPGQMTSFDLSPLPGGYRATWANPTDDDFALARVYAGGNNSFATAVSVAEVAANYYVATGLPATTPVFVWVRALDASGNAGQVLGPLEVAPTLGAGSAVYDIGSAAVPDPNLGVAGDTAINDGGEYFLKTTTGWVRRGDLTPDPGSEVYFYGSGEALTVFPPPSSFGVDGDIAIGPDGSVLRKVAGAWVDVELIIPAPTGLSAVVTILAADILNVSGTVYDLHVEWTAGNYLTEIDIGWIPSADLTNLTGAIWGVLDGVSATGFHDFPLIRETILAGRAVRVRHIGSFGQRGPWTHALYSSDTTLSIDSFAADNTQIESGDTVTLTWTMRNAESASIDQGVGALLASQLESGSTQVSPTAPIRYTLTATGGGKTVTKVVTVTVGPGLAQPSITSFAPDDSTLTTTQTTTVRWTAVNGVSGTIDGPFVNRALTTPELTAGTESIGPLLAGTQTYRLRINGEPGTTQAIRTFSVTVTTATPDAATIDTFTRNPATIESGESSLLSWTTSNAISVLLNGSTVSGDGTMSVSPTVTTTYTLRANGAGNTVTESVTVTVTQPPDPDPDPEVVSLTASATTIAEGGSVTLSWVTRNGDTRELIASLPDGTGIVRYMNQAASGSRTFTPAVTMTYQIQVWNAVDPPGTLDAAFITVTVTVPAAVVDSFSVSPTSPAAGEDFTLSWTTTGATRVTLRVTFLGIYVDSGGDRPADGSVTFSLASGTTRSYRIRAYNSADVYTESSTITITIP